MSEVSRSVVLEFSRSPIPGRVKTRLARTEGAVEAARLYRLLAEAVHTPLIEAQARGLLDVALCTPDGDPAWLPEARLHFNQGPGDLGARLTRCFDRAFEVGAARVLCVGTDIVGLDVPFLERALEALDEADVVLAPTPDGGYGLIGLRTTASALFQEIDWSTSAVAEQTRARARAAGLSVQELRGLRDVDVAPDLEGVIPRLSILIPALNEAPRLRTNLHRLLAEVAEAREEVEIILADGGSTDETAALARGLGLRVLVAPRGRGLQLAAAANAARGRWLWTLHADARLAPHALAGVLAFCRRDEHPWGFCTTRIDLPSPILRLITTLTELRASLLRLPYGDQGILVKRAVFDHCGGYAQVPLMEDVLLARQLARYGPPGRMSATLVIDGRRWTHHGVLGATLRNLSTLARFLLLGADPGHLAAGYGRGHDA